MQSVKLIDILDLDKKVIMPIFDVVTIIINSKYFNMEMNHEFCAKFRQDLKAHGLKYVIVELLTSNSEKVPLKKQYLARECKKPAFAAKIEEAITAVGDSNRSLRPALNSLRTEIIGAK